MKKLFFCIFILVLNAGYAQHLPHPSAVFEWEMLPVSLDGAVEERKLIDWPTETLDNFRIIHYTLQGSQTMDLHSEEERLVLVTNGALSLKMAEEETALAQRSVGWIPAHKPISITVGNDNKASFFFIEWDSELVDGELRPIDTNPVLFDYSEMEYKENSKGGRRAVMQAPTQTLRELEMHITTLKEGEKSHDPHVHADEEIILVLQGEVEEMINGTPYRLGAGSVIYLAAFDPHGIRNAGKGSCEYYAIRWITEKTEK
ncbi:cupin domain-containing protein [Cyclobacterium plantarum]|uniref:cupin domain-containing protein n=1 Tax=Cyclobacterium plantarum TaxID=2716263 RepID=UPI003F6F21CF